MDEEAAFNAALDAHPDDWVTRLVFADWLEERGDERAEGYRVLGLLRRVPDIWENGTAWFLSPEYRAHWGWPGAVIAPEWLAQIRRAHCNPNDLSPCISWPTRAELEDAAARAFARLPAARRDQLLRGTGVSA